MPDSPGPATSVMLKASELYQDLFKNHQRGSLRTLFLQGAAGTFGLKVAFSGFSLILNVLLTRLLGAAGYGAYTYAFAWAVLLGVPAMLGMDQVLVRAFATYHVESAWGRMRGESRPGMKRCGWFSSAITARGRSSAMAAGW